MLSGQSFMQPIWRIMAQIKRAASLWTPPSLWKIKLGSKISSKLRCPVHPLWITGSPSGRSVFPGCRVSIVADAVRNILVALRFRRCASRKPLDRLDARQFGLTMAAHHKPDARFVFAVKSEDLGRDRLALIAIVERTSRMSISGM